MLRLIDERFLIWYLDDVEHGRPVHSLCPDLAVMLKMYIKSDCCTCMCSVPGNLFGLYMYMWA